MKKLRFKTEIRYHRVVALLMIVSMLFVMSPMAIVAEGESKTENSKCAIVDLAGGVLNTYNCTAEAIGWEKATEGGRTGLINNKANAIYYLKINVDDNLMYNLENDTPVDVTIEYFDKSERQQMCILYDSYNITPVIRDNKVENETAGLRFKGGGEWKTHTFRINDMMAANRQGGRFDLSVSMWTPSSVYFSEDVLIGKVTIKYGEYDSYHDFQELSSPYAGNIFAKDEVVKLSIDTVGRVENGIAAGVAKYKVCDEDGSLVYEGEVTLPELGFKEKGSAEFTLSNPGKYGIYYVEIAIDSWPVSEPEKVKHFEIDEMSFSVAMVFEPGEAANNYLLGVTQQIGVKQRGDRQKVAEIISRGGFGHIRMEDPDSRVINGKWTITDEFMEMYKMIRDYNVEIMLIFEGPTTANTTTWANNNPPHTPETYEDYAEYCRDLAEQTKGIVDYFELWNEYNIKTRNNDPLAGFDHYGKFMSLAAKKVKEVNPDAITLGITAAGESGAADGDHGTAPKFTTEVFKNGGHKGLDYVSVHPYDFTGNFRVDRFVNDAKGLEEVIAEYGSGQKMWADEFGWGTTDPGTSMDYTYEEQYQNFICQLMIGMYYTNYEKFTIYSLCDRLNRKELEENWGIINSWNDGKNRQPYGAKPSYIALVAYNQFLGNSKPDMVFDDNKAYAAHYYNERLDKDVVLLVSNNEEKKMSLNLGTNSIEVYDKYGNKFSNLKSQDNIFDVSISKDPVYLVGDMKKFEKAESRTPMVVTESAEVTAAAGDFAKLSFVKNTDKELYVSIDGAEVVENTGFKGNRAVVTVKCPSGEAEKKSVVVTVHDAEGNTYYAQNHKINIIDPVTMEITTERAETMSNNRLRIKALVKNTATKGVYSGKVELFKPEHIVNNNNNVQRFVNLQPGEEIVFYFNIPEIVSKTLFSVSTRLTLDNGFVKEIDEEVSFATAVYTDKKPVMDGVISRGEWNGSWMGANEKDNVISLLNTDWTGPDDLSFNANLMWDDEYFYFLLAIRDDVYFVKHEPQGPVQTWRGDGLQIGFNDSKSINNVLANIFSEISVGETQGIGPIIYKSKALYEETGQDFIMEDAELAIKTYDGYRIYEGAVKWDTLFYNDYKVDTESPFSISFLVNDNDGDGRKFFMEYGSGIGMTKDSFLFIPMKFTK